LLIRSDFSRAAPAVKDFLSFISPVLRTRNFHQFTDIQATVKNYFQLFFERHRPRSHKEQGATISQPRISASVFFKFFSGGLQGSNRVGFLPRKGIEKMEVGAISSE
jgi:hypothetical protein